MIVREETYRNGQLVSARDVNIDVPPEIVNRDTIRGRAKTALAVNATYLAIASPTAPQVAAQVRALTMQATGVIRLTLDQLDDTAGT